MARKGIRRTHTGCITCKTRRIKCDEAHPHCLRCTSIGRNCDGYKPWVPKSLNRIQPSTIPGLRISEIRSLDFFRQVIAPIAAGPLHCSFWSFEVTRMMHQDSGVRHAVIAMSTLYENLHAVTQQRSLANSAIDHYNIAIQLVINFRAQNGHLDAVLVACIIFMSIEFYNGNPKKAVTHYHHGMSILRSYKPYLPLVSRFRELNVYVLLFSDISDSVSLGERDSSLLGQYFGSLSQARKALNWLVYQSMSVATFVSQSFHCDSPDSHLKIQTMRQKMNNALDDWSLAAMPLRSHLPMDHKARFHMLEARFWVCKIWVNVGLSEASVHNSYEENFRNILEMISTTCVEEIYPDHGFSAVLHFVITRCRNQDVRLRALSLLKAQCRSEETLYDLKLLYETAREATEEEVTNRLRALESDNRIHPTTLRYYVISIEIKSLENVA